MSDTFYINSEVRNNKIMLTYCHQGDVKYAQVDNYKPVLYGLSADPNTGFKELVSGKNLEPTQFSSIREANNVIREARNNNDVTVFGNRNFNYTFLHENFKNMESSYDISKIRGAMIDIETIADVGFPDPGKAEWPINVLTIYDTITEKYWIWGESPFDRCKYVDKLLEHGVTLDDIVYEHIEDEVKMLKHLLRWWREHLPAYITGWNSSHFDLPYLCHRLQRLGLDMNKLSPWKSVFIKEGEYFGKPEYTVYISGIADLDYLPIYRDSPSIPTRSSYKLDFIGEIELKRKKVDFSHVANNLRELRRNDYNLFTTYNIIDVELIKSLEDKLGLISTAIAVAYAAGINYGDVSSPVKTWANMVYRTLISDGVVLPNVKEHEVSGFQGGYVKPPQVGKHRWVCSFDLASLYPSLIMQYNISPETITSVVVPEVNVDTMLDRVQYKTSDDLSVCPSGNTFRRDEFGVMGREMLRLYTERKAIKKEMLIHEQKEVTAETESSKRADGNGRVTTNDVDNVGGMSDTELAEYWAYHKKQAILKHNGQMTRKILLNSGYGALANIYFPLFDLRLAESITLSGQLSIRWAGKCMNEYLNSIHKTTDVDYIIYTDTDSIYVSMEAVAERLSNGGKNFDTNNPDDLHKVVDALDKFCQDHAEPALSRGYEEMHKYCNSYQQKMFMDREVISDNSVFCSKKRYMMSVWNSEGVAFDTAYIKVMGMDMVKSSTPQTVRDAMKKTADIVLNGNEQQLHKFVKGFKEEFRRMPPEAIAFPRGVNKLEETYCRPNGTFRDDVTVVINSRAAINFNNAVKSNDLDYPLIVNGDKIKYVHLTEPNKYQTHVFGFTDVLPKELDIHKKVDYDTMYEKTYGKPMSDLVNIIGWSLAPRASIDAFFS